MAHCLGSRQRDARERGGPIRYRKRNQSLAAQGIAGERRKKREAERRSDLKGKKGGRSATLNTSRAEDKCLLGRGGGESPEKVEKEGKQVGLKGTGEGRLSPLLYQKSSF